MAKRSVAKRWWYRFIWLTCRIILTIYVGMRRKLNGHIPTTGGALVCSNHQSHLDPMLVGTAFSRRANYLARKTLFDNPAFGWLCKSLDAIPIDRDGMGLGGVKETLRRLRREEIVVIFPEGTRCTDGKIAPLKPGICSIARRGRCAMIPAGIAGSFEAWPKGRKFPFPGRVRLYFGEPITVEQIAAYSDEELLAELTQRIENCQQVAQRWRDEGKLPNA